MRTVRFEIKFDTPHTTYSSGQHVTGSVVVELQKEKKFRGIELCLFGGAKVHWTERRGRSRRRFTARETYIEHSVYVVGGPNSDIVLPPGIHNYPFRLILPTGIPSSFESTHGHVRYTVKAAMIRPWRFDYRCKGAITVLNPLDLNNEPGISEPVQTTTEKRLWFGFGSPITVVISVPFTGYVPGQRCRGTCEINNPTGNGISVHACLVQVITYTSKRRKKVKQQVVSEEAIGGVSPHGSKTSSFSLQVPALPDSYLNHCNYIDINYYFEITGRIGGFHRDLHAIVPIVIGSIPPRTQFAYMTLWQQQCPSSQMNAAQLNVVHKLETDIQVTTPTAPDPFFQYPEMPPPTYEECVGGKINIKNEEDDEHVQGVMDFAPRYPVYSFKENTHNNS